MSALKLSLEVLYFALQPSGLKVLFLLNYLIIASTSSTTGASRCSGWALESWGKSELIKNWHVLTAKFSREFLLHRVFDNIENSICYSFCFVCCFVVIGLLVLCRYVEAYCFLNWKANSWLFLLHHLPYMLLKYSLI